MAPSGVVAVIERKLFQLMQNQSSVFHLQRHSPTISARHIVGLIALGRAALEAGFGKVKSVVGGRMEVSDVGGNC